MERHQRFWSKVLKTESCWFWQGSTNGNVWFEGKLHVARRVTYYLCKGNWPDHGPSLSCGNPECINPDHYIWPSINDLIAWADQPHPFGSDISKKGDHVLKQTVSGCVDSATIRRVWVATFGPFPPRHFLRRMCEEKTCVKADHFCLTPYSVPEEKQDLSGMSELELKEHKRLMRSRPQNDRSDADEKEYRRMIRKEKRDAAKAYREMIKAELET